MNKALRKLLVLVLAIVVSASAIVGGTYAWFTDTVTSGRNTIQSGNLDMVVSYKPYGAENTTWTEVTKDTKVFKENALYEPGYTEAVWLKIENKGNLAFRYQAALNILSETRGTNQAGNYFNLSDSLVVKSANVTDTSMESIYPTRASLDSFAFGSAANSFEKGLNSEDLTITTNGVAYPENDPEYGDYSTSYVLVILEMPTTVGNEANHNGNAPAIQLGLNVLATQLVHEEDSFGNDYDADAEYIPMVSTLAQLRDALAKGGEFVLGADITVERTDLLYKADGGHSDGSAFFVKADTVLDLNGHDITINAGNVWADVFFMNWGADLTIKGDGDITADCSIACVYDANSTLNVEGGDFYVTANNDMLYAIYGKINVSGGTFTTSYWNTINIYGSGRVELVDVSGGSFEGWNPAASPDGNLLADGYKTVSEVKDGVTWYNVVPV